MAVLRIVASLFLLAAAALSTWQTIDALAARRALRTELAEISHVRYGLLNADRWVDQLVPILEAQIDALDFKASSRASLRPMIRNALSRLLDQIKEKMSAPPPAPPGGGAPAGGLLGQGNAFIVNAIIGALRPHIPEYADMVLAELGRPDAKQALRNYIKSVLTESAKNTFGNVDMTYYSSILKEHGCADAPACKQVIEDRIHDMDSKIMRDYLGVLVPSALAFLLLLTTAGPVLPRSSTIVLLLFCVVLLLGGVLSPMLEVDAKISRLSMTFLGTPISFTDQVLYFQSKSVLEVFHTLIATGRPDMWIVGVLVLMFSVVFPALKILTSSAYLYQAGFASAQRRGPVFCARVVEVVDGGCDGARHLHGVCRFQRPHLEHNARPAADRRGGGYTHRQLENPAGVLPVHRLLSGEPVSLQGVVARDPSHAGPRLELSGSPARTARFISRALDMPDQALTSWLRSCFDPVSTRERNKPESEPEEGG